MAEAIANTDAGCDATLRMTFATQPVGSAGSHVAVVTVIAASLPSSIQSRFRARLLGTEQSRSPKLVPARAQTAGGERICRRRRYGAPASLWHDSIVCEEDLILAAPGSSLSCWYL
jgi:hypothetical protein